MGCLELPSWFHHAVDVMYPKLLVFWTDGARWMRLMCDVAQVIDRPELETKALN